MCWQSGMCIKMSGGKLYNNFYSITYPITETQMWETLKTVDPFLPAPVFPTKKYDAYTSNHMV